MTSVVTRVGEVLRREWPLAVVLLGIVVGLSVSRPGTSGAGTVLLAASVVFGAWLRTVLPSERAACCGSAARGSTSPRSPFFGLGLTVLALVVPSPS